MYSIYIFFNFFIFIGYTYPANVGGGRQTEGETNRGGETNRRGHTLGTHGPSEMVAVQLDVYAPCVYF